MMSSIVGYALPISFFLPLIQVAGFWYFWKQKITSPWWFFSIGLVAMYLIMAWCFTSTFSNIGLSGTASETNGSVIDSLSMHYVMVTLAGCLVGAGLLFGLRKFFGNS